MTDQQLEDFVKIAVKSGRVFVSQSVYDKLRKLPAAHPAWRQLNQLEVVVNSQLCPGGVAAVDFEALNKYTRPGYC